MRLVSLSLAAFTFLLAGRADAWTEAHAAKDDATIQVDARGKAHVEHQIEYRVLRGPFKGFELVGIEKGAETTAAVEATIDDGSDVAAHAVRVNEKTLRVVVDEASRVKKGSVRFRLAYDVDFIAMSELVRDGAMYKLVWRAPIAQEGLDGVRTTFALPEAPTTPFPVHPETGNRDELIAFEHRRVPGNDVLEIVRPHIARGEAGVYALRIDPKAFAIDPPASSSSEAVHDDALDRATATRTGWTAVALGVLFALLVWLKGEEFAARCVLNGVRMRGLFTKTTKYRVPVALLGTAGGIWFLEKGDFLSAAALLALSVLASVARASVPERELRGPGKWLPFRPEDSFAKSAARSFAFDTASRRGKSVFALLFGAIALAGFLAHYYALGVDPVPVAITFAAMSAVLFASGRMRDLPYETSDAASKLARVFHVLNGDASLRVTPWGRVPLGHAEPDEMRLLVLPRRPIQGFVSLELGVVVEWTWNASLGICELLVRVQDGSPAAAKMTRLQTARVVPGRREGERVYMVSLATNNPRAIANAVREWTQHLSERRDPKSTAVWGGAERRVRKTAAPQMAAA